jgi:AmmeMemoRadiSam system protein A
MLSNEIRKYLLRLARTAIEAKLIGENLIPQKAEFPILDKKQGAFVTLNKDGNLRGCIGYILASKPLYNTIIDVAKAAAFDDPRFPKLEINELLECEIEISIISEMIPVSSIDEIKVGRDGLLLKNGFYSGLLLPQVAIEWEWDKIEFLEQTSHKAGLHKNVWKEKETKLYRFTAEVFKENDY